MFTKKELQHLSNLARIELKDKELKKYSHELDSILKYIQQLEELDVSSLKPSAHVLHSFNIFREDKVKPSIEIEKILKNSPGSKGKFFRVPKVIE